MSSQLRVSASSRDTASAVSLEQANSSESPTNRPHTAGELVAGFLDRCDTVASRFGAADVLRSLNDRPVAAFAWQRNRAACDFCGCALDELERPSSATAVPACESSSIRAKLCSSLATRRSPASCSSVFRGPSRYVLE